MHKNYIGLVAVILILLSSCSSVSHVHKSFVNNPVIAHRGAWKTNHLPENSIASLQQAIKIGCAGSEFDVHLTADDSLVICHNDDYEGMVIEKSTYAQLAAKPLANGEPMPTLQQYLTEGMKQNKTRLILEIKKSVISKERTLELTQKCIDKVHQLNADKWIVYISFDYEACLKVRALDKNANIQYLNGDIPPAKIKADGLNGIDYHFSVFHKNPQWITDAKALKIALNAWTVNKKEDIHYFLDQKFDYITTNEPEEVFQLLHTK